jgi:hypothetical protein
MFVSEVLRFRAGSCPHTRIITQGLPGTISPTYYKHLQTVDITLGPGQRWAVEVALGWFVEHLS